jgi:hypothetical protein
MTKMIPRESQIEMAKELKYVLLTYGLAYCAAEERTGKTLATLVTANETPASRVVILTTKAALIGWKKTLAGYDVNKPVELTNYHNAHKIEIKPDTLFILDEAHTALSAYPKPGKIWKSVKALTKLSRIIFSSATPNAQGLQMLYHQLALSSYSPFKSHPNFYSWFRAYGIPSFVLVRGIEVQQYNKVKTEEVRAMVKHLFVSRTRAELGFEHEPQDVLHYIELDEVTKLVYNELLDNQMVKLKAGDLICDTVMKLRTSLHMLEGGVAKLGNNYVVLANEERVRYIKEHFGDTEDVVIMYNYIAERTKLEQHFKKARILQATSNAEGVDLSMHKHLVIYSMNFSTSKYTQRRARQANEERKEEINVHYLLTKKAVSSQVYRTVAKNKRNFVDSVFERTKL